MAGPLLQKPEARLGMYGTDNGSSSRESLQERSASQSAGLQLEPVQDETWMQDKSPAYQLIRVYRDVIIGALKDMGCGTPSEVGSVRRWMGSDSFSHCCDLSRWEEGWIRETFISIESLPHASRKPITRECIEMMKALSGMGLDTHNITSAENHYEQGGM